MNAVARGVVFAVLLLLAAEASAQSNRLVGTWSATFPTSRGPFAASWVTFGADGRCQQRIIVPAGAYTYYCQYQLAVDGIMLSVRHYAYEPRNLVAGMPINQTMTFQLQWLGNDLFVVMDGGVPVRYVRQS